MRACEGNDENRSNMKHSCCEEVKALVLENQELVNLVKAQEELLSRYRLGTRRGVDAIIDRITTAKEKLNWGKDIVKLKGRAQVTIQAEIDRLNDKRNQDGGK